MLRKERVINEVLGAETTLTPSDLYNKDFAKVTFGGYDKKEVDEYLERVAEVLEGLIGQVRALREKGDEQRKSLDELRNLETTMRNALVASQRYGEDVLDAARREANVLVEEARLKKEQAQLEAMKLPEALARDIQLLEQQRSRLRVEMLSILETHKRLLDSLVPAPPPTNMASLGAILSEPAQEPRAPQFLPGLGSGLSGGLPGLGTGRPAAQAAPQKPAGAGTSEQTPPLPAAAPATGQAPRPGQTTSSPSFDMDDEQDSDESVVQWKMDS